MTVRTIIRPVTRPVASAAIPTNRGPELVVNGSFSSDTVWVKGTFWTIAAGVAVRAVDPSSSSISQPIELRAGVQYEVIFTITAFVAGGITARFTGGTGVNGTTRGAIGTYTQTITALSGNNTLTMQASGGTSATIDNVSVREVLY